MNTKLLDDSPFENIRYVSLRLLWDCNLRCIMCDHPHRPRKEMPLEIAHNVLDQLTHPVRLTFIGGEPCLWLIKYPEILRRAFDEGHVVHIISNGLLIPKLPDFVNAFRDREVSIQFSIDGYEQLYEQIRKRSSWKKLTQVIRLLHRTRLNHNNNRAVITANYLLMRCTLDSLPQFIKYCSDEGVDAVSLTYTMIYESMVSRGEITEDQSVYYCQEATNEAIQAAIEEAKRTGISLTCPPLLGSSKMGKTIIGPPRDTIAPGKSLLPDSSVACSKPWKEIFVNQDGTIVPCCCGPNIGPAVGNIKDGLKELWNGEPINQVRQALIKGQFHDKCKCGINISAVGRQTGEESFFTKFEKNRK